MYSYDWTLGKETKKESPIVGDSHKSVASFILNDSFYLDLRIIS